MTIDEMLDPRTTAVIVIDKQAGYFEPGHVMGRGMSLPDDSATVLESIDDFIERSRRAGVEVVWTQMVENTEESPRNIAAIMNNDPDDVHSITALGKPSFEIYGRVKPLDSERVITKYRYNAFSQTDLGEYFRQKDVKTVVLVGGYASRCVLASCFGAAGEDLMCVVIKGLVINQSIVSHEVQTLYDVVDAILGKAIDKEKIHALWETPDALGG